ncbi:MAG: mucoidy inhibitor MuiA family protein [Spirochaetes bacterium]|nr:mucoidy inhibitor MuiA family protein [Spirochaetota bacterium]
MKGYIKLICGIAVFSLLTAVQAQNVKPKAKIYNPAKPAAGTGAGIINENSGEITVDSKIDKITVYSDRAMITRTASVELNAGEQSLLFHNIPYEIDVNSVRVQGSGDAVLKDIQIKTAYFSEVQGEAVKKLFDRKKAIEDSLKEITDKLNEAKNEKKFIEAISVKLTSSSEKSGPVELSPDKWEKMVRFYRTRQEALNKEIRETGRARQQVQNQLNQVNNEIAHLQNRQNKSKYDIHALVQMKKRGKLKLNLSYLIYNTGWRPAYDMRVSTEEHKLNIAYNAVVRQNTAEDWDNVSLELSTARPGVGGQHPELTPWRISRFIPVYPKAAPSRDYEGSEMRKKEAMSQMMNVMPSEKDEASAAEPEEAPAPAIVSENAGVSSQTTSVVFQIPGRHSIPGNNEEHKVTIMLKEFDVNFRYSAVPKLTPYAYLKARAVNQTEYPMLPGNTNIFLDNNFVANARLQNVAPGEEFWTFLGIDEGIKVEHKLLKKDVSAEGVFSKINKVTYDYLIQLTSNKKHEEEIVVWDQIPIAESQDIKVELLEPQYQKDSGRLKKNELEYLEWMYKIKPGEKIKIQLKFSVTHPENMKVTGLE